MLLWRLIVVRCLLSVVDFCCVFFALSRCVLYICCVLVLPMLFCFMFVAFCFLIVALRVMRVVCCAVICVNACLFNMF